MKISALAPALPAAPKPAAARWTTAARTRTLAVLAAVVVVGVVLSIGVGSARSTPADLWHAFVSYSGSVMDLTIRGIRVPRTVTALAVGAALGVAGTLVQGHTRNPIAEPGLLGVNHGAALAIVATTAAVGPLAFPAQAGLAFVGALVASLVVFGIGSVDRRGGSPTTLVLVGAAVTSMCLGLVSAIVLLSEAALETLRFWQVGSVAGRSGALELLWPVLLVGGLLAWLNATQLNALALGEAAATSLGVTTARARGVGLAALVLLAGAAVTIAGPIAFVGLLVPHIARWAIGADYRWLVPASALIGSAIVLLSDTLGRIIARPGELPVGVVVALVGAPVFVYIARRKRVVSA
ncbi:FecCD family ABC transporter permease [Zhihengliuella halotolerans]|uniref:Iron complex transport system permease protein n=1 Tax=Zhihengliuella halotolerans TaxID=370736 RepID=A0A4Q8AH74_9MICC|nr:iron ABC transporter permease [Zhihengliuella halotolerans]RZU63698.1 iron complex transport system permease protein [Zhihengliuella halotolerans]